MDYNLLIERWIPVIRHDGKYDRVGIREALTQAGGIRQIAASNPIDPLKVRKLSLTQTNSQLASISQSPVDQFVSIEKLASNWRE